MKTPPPLLPHIRDQTICEHLMAPIVRVPPVLRLTRSPRRILKKGWRRQLREEQRDLSERRGIVLPLTLREDGQPKRLSDVKRERGEEDVASRPLSPAPKRQRASADFPERKYSLLMNHRK